MWLIIVASSYDRTNITFLRAESGYYQFLAHAPPATQENLLRGFWKTSYKGHYIPIALTLEFAQTKLAGTSARYWKWRAVAAISLLAAALFGLGTAVASAFRIGSVAAYCISAGITALVVLQPLMIEFIAWPFETLFLGWMILSTVTLRALVGIVSDAKPRKWMWIAAGAAYGSMHWAGMGLATAAATSGVFALLLISMARGGFTSLGKYKRSLLVAFALLLFLSLCHAVCMSTLLPQSNIKLSTGPPAPLARPLLGFLAVYPLFISHTLFAALPVPTDVVKTLQNAWPFGIATILFLPFVAINGLRHPPQELTPRRAVMVVITTFVTIAYVVLVGTIAVRQAREASPIPFFGYFVGARYVVPFTSVFFGAFVLAAFGLGARKTRAVSIASVILGVCAFMSQRQFATDVYPRLQPNSQLSHERTWSLIKAMAKESRLASLPVPNVPMGQLTQEFHDYDLKLFEPLLRHELGLQPQEHIEFVAIQEVLHARASEYAINVPSFSRLRRSLRLQQPKH